MIDLAQCHWVVDDNHRLFLASAPSLRAPFRFDCFTESFVSSRRLSAQEAQAITQAAIESGMRPMTFVSSDVGIAFLQGLMSQTSDEVRVA